MVFLVALTAGEILAVILFLEHPEYQIVGHKTGIVHRMDGVNGKRILPQSILTHGRFPRRDDQRIAESDAF